MSLGRKQRITNEAWLEAVATVESAVSEAALGELVAATIEDIKAKTAGKKAAYAWSGGKDSIVLGKLCEAADVTDSMIGVCDLEYPAFAAWIEANKPEGCEVINTHQGLDWLARHPEMLFPQNSAAAGRWFSIVQHRAQRIYAKAHGLDLIILGRRRADGNYVGRGTNIYTDGNLGGSYYMWCFQFDQYPPETFDGYAVWSESADCDWMMPAGITMTTEEGEEYATTYGDIQTTMQENILKFIMGEKDIDSEWDAYVETLYNMDLQTCIDIKQAALDRYNAR